MSVLPPMSAGGDHVTVMSVPVIRPASRSCGALGGSGIMYAHQSIALYTVLSTLLLHYVALCFCLRVHPKLGSSLRGISKSDISGLASLFLK